MTRSYHSRPSDGGHDITGAETREEPTQRSVDTGVAPGTLEGPGRALLIYNRPTPEAVAAPHMRLLLPLSAERLRNLAARPWPSRRRPMFTMDPDRLLSAVLRQYLFSSVYRAAAESLASEHASRLASMQAAERNIEEHLAEQQEAQFRRRRQEAITEELLDIVSGFAASTSMSRAGSGSSAVG